MLAHDADDGSGRVAEGEEQHGELEHAGGEEVTCERGCEKEEEGSDSDASTKFSESPSPKKGKRAYDSDSSADSSRIGMEPKRAASKRTRRGR